MLANMILALLLSNFLKTYTTSKTCFTESSSKMLKDMGALAITLQVPQLIKLLCTNVCCCVVLKIACQPQTCCHK